MRSTNPKDTLAMMHMELDKELEMANGGSGKSSKPSPKDYRFVSDFNPAPKPTHSGKPPVYDHRGGEADITSKRN